ncbi:MAG: PilW family protein [Gammaproteobacteria bacterium]|jgi:type IV pilus assembly protein PilW|nr:PilW family protein [Gammaproteobacteria bacterium]
MTIVKKQSGMTLIEIMIALTLSLVLIGGVIQLFLTSKQTFNMNEAMARVQESGRFALDTISRDLRMAGFQGCADPGAVPSESVVKTNSPTANLLQSAITGNEGSAASDSLTVQFASGDATRLVSNTDPVNATIVAQSNPDNISVNEVVMMADCTTAHLVRITDVANNASDVTFTYGAAENDLGALSKAYGPGSTQIMRFNSVSYSVAPTGRSNARGEAITALFRQGINDAAPVELVEGVENLQIQYGERLADGTVRFSDADAAGLDMSRVESVRIGLLMVEVDTANSQLDNKTYILAGTSVAPEGSSATVTHPVDNRLRRAFNTTISLRNRR